MKKYSLLVIVLLQSIIVLGQEIPIKKELPTIVPPSPTVAALMKFEEIPVNNYTGVPDISIPLFNSTTRSKDINLNLSLKYHSTGVAVDEKASNVGLGWSLFAGGTISRTVKGMPDELLKEPYTFEAKIGIYQDQTTVTNFPNRYDEFLNIIDNVSNPTNAQKELRKEYLFESNEKGKYDNEHDLWQFNFMGHTGRFFIKKNNVNGQLEVKPLDNYTLKVINHYGVSGNTFTPTGFTIYDDKGYKYIFNVIETTTTSSLIAKAVETLDEIINMSDGFTYNSSFHLKEVRDNNNNLIIDFIYSNDIAKETAIDKTETNGAPVNFSMSTLIATSEGLGGQYPDTCHSTINSNMEPTYSHSTSQRNTTVKKLDRIDVNGIVKIFFNYQLGREDDNFFLPQVNSYVFKGIVVKDWAESNIKQIDLTHFYSTTINKRLMLESVKFKNFLNSKVEVYGLEYVSNINNYGPNYIKKDLWGYFKIPIFNQDYSREINRYYCTTELLQKMTLPVGGSIVFDFEANTYSHIGSDALSNFDDNPYNWDYDWNNAVFVDANTNQSQFLFTINDSQDIWLSSEIVTNENNVFRDYSFELYKVVGTTEVLMPNLNLSCLNCGTYNTAILLSNVEPGTYKVKFNTIDLNLNNVLTQATITAQYKLRNSNNFQFVYGGGNRIKRIGYFDVDVPKNVYQGFLSNVPKKEKNYVYNFHEFPLKSSGSLVSAKPVHKYLITKRPCIECIGQLDTNTYTFEVTTSFNNLTQVKTAGADIGYQNISIYETNNGKSEFVYNSPIDYPYDTSVPSYPFIMDNDTQEHYRGLITLERIKDNTGRKLAETVYGYEYETYTQRIGLKTMYIGGLNSCPTSAKYHSYEAYRNYVRRCAQNSDNPEYNTLTNGEATAGGPWVYACLQFGTWEPLDDCPCFCYCGEPDEFIGHVYRYETYGWAKLISKITKNYFYEGATQKTVQTDETFTYHDLNKQLDEYTKNNSLGDILKTKYFYHTGNSIHSQNRISEIEKIETYKNESLLSSSKINYINTFEDNVSYLPQTILTSKGSASLENRVKYNAYDNYGHPLEVQQENGTVISYLWGYNQSQPIAKIENATNAQIRSALGVTDLNLVSEANLVTINNLRTNTSFANAMITTYTYIPLVGITSVTDPKGDKMTYIYDDFNRLKEVRDKNNNILSENEYHYRTQN
jgi:YD repeat-containing protein